MKKYKIFPDLGVYTPDNWLNERGYRMITFKQHVAIFKRNGDVITIYHMTDTRSDYPMLFHE
ncbi:MAG: hypothetical protein HUJ53_04240 [Holdemanella sp.]|nr:hypothetical protein [Holdemanella sp.]